MRNIGAVSKRELYAQRWMVTGVTASVPSYKEMDSAGHKEWVVDVYIGPLDTQTTNIVVDVPIAPYAKQLVTGVRQPITLARSKQGKYTVIGRAKILAAGAQMPDESILEPTYHEVKHNLAQLDLLFVADLDYALEPFQLNEDTAFQADPDAPFQIVTATDAFGRQVAGPDAEEGQEVFAAEPQTVTTARHTVFFPAQFGPYGNEDAMRWGDEDSVFQPNIRKVVELES